MPRFGSPELIELYNTLESSEPRGHELAAVLERRNTRIRFAPIVGGFTLNFINTVFLQPLPPEHSQEVFKYWVALLAHEACHVEQGFYVDSVQQEVRAYLAQCQVAQELGLVDAFVEALLKACQNVDLTQPDQLSAARRAIDDLLGPQPATMLYEALPVLQPTGFRAIIPALVELRALGRTLFIRKA